MGTLNYIFDHTNPAQWALVTMAAAAVCMSVYVPVSRLVRFLAKAVSKAYKRRVSASERREIKSILTQLYYGTKQAQS